jgi:hypothetical protein
MGELRRLCQVLSRSDQSGALLRRIHARQVETLAAQVGAGSNFRLSPWPRRSHDGSSRSCLYGRRSSFLE